MIEIRVAPVLFGPDPSTSAALAALGDLWVAAWQKAMPQIDFATRRPWFFEHAAKLTAEGFVTLAAYSGDALQGFIMLHADRQLIDQLAVAVEAWGSGAASSLLAEARRLSPNGLTLDVNCDNPRAIRFYEREGFAKVSEGVNPLSGLKTQRMRWQP